MDSALAAVLAVQSALGPQGKIDSVSPSRIVAKVSQEKRHRALSRIGGKISGSVQQSRGRSIEVGGARLTDQAQEEPDMPKVDLDTTPFFRV